MAKVWCEYCQEEHDENELQRRRLNTAYVDEELNWMTSCEAAYEESVSYYKELWTDYYASIR